LNRTQFLFLPRENFLSTKNPLFSDLVTGTENLDLPWNPKSLSALPEPNFLWVKFTSSFNEKKGPVKVVDQLMIYDVTSVIESAWSRSKPARLVLSRV
jgi:hypothetical protein